MAESPLGLRRGSLLLKGGTKYYDPGPGGGAQSQAQLEAMTRLDGRARDRLQRRTTAGPGALSSPIRILESSSSVPKRCVPQCPSTTMPHSSAEALC